MTSVSAATLQQQHAAFKVGALPSKGQWLPQHAELTCLSSVPKAQLAAWIPSKSCVACAGFSVSSEGPIGAAVGFVASASGSLNPSRRSDTLQ